jgi:hypothetical protein
VVLIVFQQYNVYHSGNNRRKQTVDEVHCESLMYFSEYQLY